MRKYVLPAALLGGLTSCGDLPTAPITQQAPVPSFSSRDVSHVPIPGQYIVVFKPGIGSSLSAAVQIRSMYGGTVDRVYTSALSGAAMHLADDAAAALRADARVQSVEPDEVFTKGSTTQLGATWGLDRIDQRNQPMNGTYVYGADGTGVTVYIIDTGINFGQADFGGRAQTGYDAITPGGTAMDCEGHGSHVAGTAGSTTYGVAKNVRLVAVRVLDCAGNGSSSSVLAGIDWVTTNRTLPAVANMSLGAGFNQTVNNAVENSIAAGVTYAVSAGNSTIDACTYTPASAPSAITVGATDDSDAFTWFSNYGPCVDLLAPGMGITSWWLGSGTNTLSGTSMSSPHVAGAAALYLQLNPNATPAQVRAALVGNATPGLVTGLVNGTPNLLLYTGFMQGQAPAPPVARFTSSCSVLSCSFDAGTSTSSSGSATYSWTFGDGLSGSGKTPSHTYAAGGTYAVTLTVTDPNGSNSKTTNVVLNRNPTTAITTPANNASFVQGSAVSFTGTAADPEDGTLTGASLVWRSSITGQIGTGTSFSTTTLPLGTHTITLIAKDAQNAADTATAIITITTNHPPTATIASPANNANLALGSSVTFTGAGSDVEDGALTGAALQWTSSINGVIGTGASFSTSTLSGGTHTITLTAKDALNATGTATLTLTINRPPTASITLPANNAAFLIGSSVAFSGAGVDPEDGALTGASLTWTSNLDGAIGTGASFSTSALSAGTHVITLTSKDSRNATDTATVTVRINRPPTASITAPANNATFSLGSAVSFTGTGSDPEDGVLTGSSLVWTSSRDGQIGTGVGFSTSGLSLGTHTITLTAKDGLNATGTATQTITIGPANLPPVAQFSSSCPTLQCTLDATASTDNVGIVKYAWNWGDGRSENRTMPTANNTWAVPGVYTITLTVTDAGGLSSSISKQVSVPNQNVPPTASITAPANGVVTAQGATITFTGSATDVEDGVLTGSSLVWSSSIDGQIGTGVTFATSALSSGTHVITLTARDILGAVGTATRTITIAGNQPPTATISAPASNAIFLIGSSVAFAGTGSDPEDGALGAGSLVWTSNLDGQIGTGASFSTSALSGGTHTITLTATDSRNATGIATRTIIVNRPPTASITAPVNNATFTQGASVAFAGTGSDPEDGALSGASLVWTSNRDGQLGTGGWGSISTLSVGTHIITLTAKDAQNVTGTATRTITITASNLPPVASFTQSCPAMQCTFDATSSTDDVGVVSYTWDFGNGHYKTVTTPTTTTTFSPSGTYTITLKVTDAGGLTNTIVKQITVGNQAPTATIAAPVNNASIPQGVAVVFTGAGSDPENGVLTGASLAWASSRDGAIGTGVSFSTTTLSVGTHVITLTATDAQGATDTDTRSITIVANQPPVATITAPAGSALFNVGSSVSFSGTGSDPESGTLTGASLVWTSSINGQIGTGTSFSTSALSGGTHTITLTARDALGATGTATRTIIINRPPSASITAPANNANFTQGSNVAITGTGSDPEDGTLNGGSLVWTSSRDGQIGTGPSFTTNNLTLGTHVITLTVKDANNVTATATRTITIAANQAPAASITAPTSNANFVASTAVTFTGTGIDPEDGSLSGGSLVWTSSLDGQIGTGASISVNGLSLGTHTITLTAKDSRNATGTATVSITVTVNSPPTVSITTPSIFAVFHQGVTVTFDGIGNDPDDGALTGASLVWTSSRDGQIGTGNTFTKNNLSAGTHTITLTAKDAQNVTTSVTRIIRIE